MPIRVIITSDFESLGKTAAEIVRQRIARTQTSGVRPGGFVLGLATGRTPTGMYRHLARAADSGSFDSSGVRTFNLDEYVGLPGDTPEERKRHEESYSSFMERELFGRMRYKFKDSHIPPGHLIDPEELTRQLDACPGDWEEQGHDAGLSIVIRPDASSEYLRQVRTEILDDYADRIDGCGGIDLQAAGVGARGHVAFHESGIPFEDSRMLLVRLDRVTRENAVADGHFPNLEDTPRFAISMGAKLVFEARTVMVLASGSRKTEPVHRSLLEVASPENPLSYGQVYAAGGGDLLYVVDRVAGDGLLKEAARLTGRGVELEDRS